jgi:hypothetical protein
MATDQPDGRIKKTVGAQRQTWRQHRCYFSAIQSWIILSAQAITMMLALELYGVISLIFTALYLSWGWARANKLGQ